MANKIGKKTFKTICILLLGILIINTFAPICSYAANEKDDADSDFGGRLFNPIAKLIRAMADGIISGLQYMFMGYGNIKETTTVDSEGAVTEVGALSGEGNDKSAKYSILFGPSTIFSNKVPALNANFINPISDTPFQIDESKTVTKSELKRVLIGGGAYTTDTEKDSINTYNDEALKQTKAASDYGFQKGKTTNISKTSGDKGADLFNIVNSDSTDEIYVEKWKYNEKTYYLVRAVFESTKTVTYFLYTDEVIENRKYRSKKICC